MEEFLKTELQCIEEKWKKYLPELLNRARQRFKSRRLRTQSSQTIENRDLSHSVQPNRSTNQERRQRPVYNIGEELLFSSFVDLSCCEQEVDYASSSIANSAESSSRQHLTLTGGHEAADFTIFDQNSANVNLESLRDQLPEGVFDQEATWLPPWQSERRASLESSDITDSIAFTDAIFVSEQIDEDGNDTGDGRREVRYS